MYNNAGYEYDGILQNKHRNSKKVCYIEHNNRGFFSCPSILSLSSSSTDVVACLTCFSAA